MAKGKNHTHMTSYVTLSNFGDANVNWFITDFPSLIKR